ncbi:HipA domain-containing protein [Candidatus Poriferisodalis sp.]|uniref:HipA domain-containing protein n=1 Tax=Candidatus Poriferisodalis sp. TaxID=3101277 RepID=UPI003B01DAED
MPPDFDRAEGCLGGVARIHQEDLCQALGIRPAEKYQDRGGPSPERIGRLMRDESSDPQRDLRHFRDALIYNWAIAAPDAHAKNCSMALLCGGRAEMTPLYDVISYLPYAQDISDRKLRTAMRIGRDYTLRKADRVSAWESTSVSIQLDPAETAACAVEILQCVPSAISDAIDSHGDEDRASPRVAELHRHIRQRCSEVRSQFRTGTVPAARAPQPTPAATPRSVLCGARTSTGTCRRRLVRRACPLHPNSPCSRKVDGPGR